METHNAEYDPDESHCSKAEPANSEQARKTEPPQFKE